jgi:UDP-N-acetylglucosamine 1-carboxyvinyltransferase
MHPQFVTLMCNADGESVLTENIFEHRFRYVDELAKMGANIELDGRMAKVIGGNTLSGTEVRTMDLRAGAAMIVAGLCASGTTTVTGIEYIKRGYHNIVGKFKSIGAHIEEYDNV